MKGFMQWFKSSNKMKRWMLLILIGILLTCYGLAKVLVTKEISFKEVIWVVGIFVSGFFAIVIGLVFLNKRTLEVLVESTDERMENRKNVNVKSLIFNKRVYDKGPNIVVIGGGTGLNTVLCGLKRHTDNLTAIVTVSGYGEQASNSRKELQMLPLDDIKDSIVSLSSKDGQMERLFNYQFTNGRLAGLNFSDIYFSAMKSINGEFQDSIMKSNEVLNVIGKVIPVTLDEMDIIAEFENGYAVKEKKRIAEAVSDKITKINRVVISPSNCRPAPGVIETIKNADCIIIGPGSLYTNVIPNLLINGVTKAIKESAAIKVYISNIMTEPGQTDNYSVSDHINAIIEHCGNGIIDYCIYDTGEIVPEYIKKYNQKGQELVEQNINKVKGVKFLQRNLSMIRDDMIRHDPSLVASSIIELICGDLKYQDKQNDPQYLMLNTKLREEKRLNKIKKNMERKEKKGILNKREKSGKSKSKFSDKYSHRIKSIKEADEKARRKAETRVSKIKDNVKEEKKEKSKTVKSKNEIKEEKKEKKEKKTNSIVKSIFKEKEKTKSKVDSMGEVKFNTATDNNSTMPKGKVDFGISENEVKDIRAQMIEKLKDSKLK